jgi:transcriptional regulator GlxA family with amidase domain
MTARDSGSPHVLRDVAVPVFAPAPSFELGVACEAFGLDRSGSGLPTYDFAVCGEHGDAAPVATTTGYALLPSHDFGRLATADLVLVVGPDPSHGSADAGRRVPASLIDRLRAAVDRGATVASLCTGAFVLADAGLLDGRRATTHWMHAAQLSAQYPAVDVEVDRLYVEDGPVVTGAGCAASVDVCLHLIRRAHGAEVANRVARRMVVPPQRDGGQAQFVEAPVPPVPAGHDLSRLLDWMVAHLDQPLSVPELAHRAAMSPRTFARRFRRTTGHTPRAWLDAQRVLLAARLLERDDTTVDAVAPAVRLRQRGHAAPPLPGRPRSAPGPIPASVPRVLTMPSARPDHAFRAS